MKTREDFRQALGASDAGFELALSRALSALPARGRSGRRRVLSLAAAAAVLALALALGGPLSGLWGRREKQPAPLSGVTSPVFTLRDALLESGRSLSPEAEALLTNARAGSAQTAHAAFTVEAVHDGALLFDLVQLRARQDGYLLIEAQWDEEKGRCEELEMPVSAFFKELAGEEGSVYDYARRSGLRLLLVQCWDQAELTDRCFAGSQWYGRQEPAAARVGHAMNLVSAADTIPVKYVCLEWVVSPDGVLEGSDAGEITLLLPAGTPLAVARSAAPVTFARANAAVEAVELRLSALGAYLRMDYAAEDADRQVPDLWLGVPMSKAAVAYAGEAGEPPQAVTVCAEPIACPNALEVSFRASDGAKETRSIPLEIVLPEASFLRDALIESGRALTPEAEAFLVRNARAAAVQTPYAAFTLSAVHDGATLHYLFRCEAAREDCLVWESSWSDDLPPEYGVNDLICNYEGFEGESGTVLEYAQRNGLRLLVAQLCEPDGGRFPYLYTADLAQKREGVGGFERLSAFGCAAEGETMEVLFAVRYWVIAPDGTLEARDEVAVTLMTLPVSAPKAVLRGAAPAQFDQSGLRVEETVLCQGALSAYGYAALSGKAAERASVSLRLGEEERALQQYYFSFVVSGSEKYPPRLVFLAEGPLDAPDAAAVEVTLDSACERREITLLSEKGG